MSLVSKSLPNFALVISSSSFILFPFLGLLADVYIGRYRAILIGVIGLAALERGRRELCT